MVYAHDRKHGLKLPAADAWFVNAGGHASAFLLKQSAAAWAGGKVLDYDAARGAGAR